MNSFYIAGVKVDFGLTYDSLISEIDSRLSRGLKTIISTTNPEFIMTAQSDPEFKSIINNSTFSVPDGVGCVLAYDFLTRGTYLKKPYFITALLLGVELGFDSLLNAKKYYERKITGVDLTYKLCEYAEKNNKSVFLLGGGSGVSGMTASVLMTKYPKLRIIGYSSDFNAVGDDTETINYLNNCLEKSRHGSIDILLIAYGHPKQEKWIERNKNNVKASVIMGVGGTFDYISTNTARAHQRIISSNLEWLSRLISQPSRIRRVFTAFPLFPFLIYKKLLFK